MPPPKPTYGTKDLEGVKFQARIEGKLDDLLEQVKTSLRILERHDEQIRTLETKVIVLERENTNEQQRRVAMELRLRSVEDAMPDNLRQSIKDMSETITKTQPIVSGFKWLAGTVGLLIVALIWQIITGQFSLVRAP